MAKKSRIHWSNGPDVPDEEPGYFQQALESIIGKRLPFPVKTLSEIEGTSRIVELQDWCAVNARPSFATGLSMIEAAELIVKQAIENGNIRA